MQTHRVRAGFTMIEMSVVLVVIGLITSGIFVGLELIRSSQLRSVAGEYEQYLHATKQFQDKYTALPGDMSNASSVWSGAHNGDGDGRIGSVTDPTAGVTSNNAEWTYAWNHLSGAGLIQGTYTGTSCITLNTCIPASRLPGAGWQILYYLQTADVADPSGEHLWGDQYGHILRFGKSSTGTSTLTSILTPQEARDIDAKLDDGMPGTGIIRSWLSSSAHFANCTITAKDTSNTASMYNEGFGDTPACGLVFITGF